MTNVSIIIKIDPSVLQLGSAIGNGVADIIDEFAKQAGPEIISAIQSVLGTDQIYQLSPAYEAIKPTLKEFQKVPGKDPGQPLILSGDHIYNALVFKETPDGVEVGVDPSKAYDAKSGWNIAEWWEMQTAYLEFGIMLAEPKLVAILESIIIDKLGLI